MLTIPNLLTILRVFLIPLFIYFLLQNDFTARIIALTLFIVAAITDFFDGYLARKWSQETSFGRFLDPLADKALVVSAILMFVILDEQIPLWMLFVIVGRDILITLLRVLAVRKGEEVKTSRLGKAKTAFQMISIVLILLILIARSYRPEIKQTYHEGRLKGKKNIEIAMDSLKSGVRNLPNKNILPHEKGLDFAASMPYFLMLLTTIVTVISGVRYLFTNVNVLKPPYRKAENKPREKT